MSLKLIYYKYIEILIYLLYAKNRFIYIIFTLYFRKSVYMRTYDELAYIYQCLVTLSEVSEGGRLGAKVPSCSCFVVCFFVYNPRGFPRGFPKNVPRSRENACSLKPNEPCDN